MWFSTIFVFALWLCSGPVIADDFQGGMKDGMPSYGSKNYSKTVKSIKKSADYGNAMAQYNLGLMYAKGENLVQDYQQALFWFRKAADQGVGIAEFSLALLYDKGLGVDQDYPQAVSWYRKAAEHGYAMASYNLGVMYDSGDGVAPDLKRNHKQGGPIF